MLCQNVKDEERNRQIKSIIMQNSKSSNTVYPGTVEGDEGELEKESHARGGTLELDKWECVV